MAVLSRPTSRVRGETVRGPSHLQRVTVEPPFHDPGLRERKGSEGSTSTPVSVARNSTEQQ